MCGIGGIVCKRPLPEEQAFIPKVILAFNDKRGGDAFGFYLKKPDVEYLYKIPISVREFYMRNGSINFSLSNLILMHTRLATVGSPEINTNNQPIETKRFVLGHNGGISNHEYLKRNFNLDYEEETDSAIIANLIEHLIENEGMTVVDAIKSAYRHLAGAMAVWLYDKKEDKLYLWRTINPLKILETEDVFMFSSLEEPLQLISERMDLKVKPEEIERDVLYILDCKTLEIKTEELVERKIYNYYPYTHEKNVDTCARCQTYYNLLNSYPKEEQSWDIRSHISELNRLSRFFNEDITIYAKAENNSWVLEGVGIIVPKELSPLLRKSNIPWGIFRKLNKKKHIFEFERKDANTGLNVIREYLIQTHLGWFLQYANILGGEVPSIYMMKNELEINLKFDNVDERTKVILRKHGFDIGKKNKIRIKIDTPRKLRETRKQLEKAVREYLNYLNVKLLKGDNSDARLG